MLTLIISKILRNIYPVIDNTICVGEEKGGFFQMNVQRAQEIATSGVIANITFNGVRVFIQNVDEKNETARIYPLDDPQKEQDVPLENLMEH